MTHCPRDLAASSSRCRSSGRLRVTKLSSACAAVAGAAAPANGRRGCQRSSPPAAAPTNSKPHSAPAAALRAVPATAAGPARLPRPGRPARHRQGPAAGWPAAGCARCTAPWPGTRSRIPPLPGPSRRPGVAGSGCPGDQQQQRHAHAQAKGNSTSAPQHIAALRDVQQPRPEARSCRGPAANRTTRPARPHHTGCRRGCPCPARSRRSRRAAGNCSKAPNIGRARMMNSPARLPSSQGCCSQACRLAPSSAATTPRAAQTKAMLST